MHIQEFQAKKMLSEYGINVPPGEVAHTADAAREAGKRLGGTAWMVKAQISAGGRGRGAFAGKQHADGQQTGGQQAEAQGGIRRANSLDEIHTHASAMLGKSLITAQTTAAGLPVTRVYIERAVAVERELALSMVVDERRKCLAVLLFGQGGGNIEGSAAAHPESVHRITVQLKNGVGEMNRAQLNSALAALALDESLSRQLSEIISKIVRLFCEKDASLVEINPLAVSNDALSNRSLFALDAKMSFDNNALHRQPAISAMESELTRDHRLASIDGFNYIPLDGDIACFAVGAGLSMATLDAIRHYHGTPANFLDLPPDSKVNRVVSALQILLAQPGIKSLMVNVFGGGIMRCDTISDAILLVNHSTPISVPVTARLAGTNAALANRRLFESVPGVFLSTNLGEAARVAVEMAKSGGAVPSHSRHSRHSNKGHVYDYGHAHGQRQSLLNRCMNALKSVSKTARK